MVKRSLGGCEMCIRFFFFKQKTAYEILSGLVGSEMCKETAFYAGYNAPLPLTCLSTLIHSFGNMFMPDYYPCSSARLVSCYALFK